MVTPFLKKKKIFPKRVRLKRGLSLRRFSRRQKSSGFSPRILKSLKLLVFSRNFLGQTLVIFLLNPHSSVLRLLTFSKFSLSVSTPQTPNLLLILSFSLCHLSSDFSVLRLLTFSEFSHSLLCRGKPHLSSFIEFPPSLSRHWILLCSGSLVLNAEPSRITSVLSAEPLGIGDFKLFFPLEPSVLGLLTFSPSLLCRGKS